MISLPGSSAQCGLVVDKNDNGHGLKDSSYPNFEYPCIVDIHFGRRNCDTGKSSWFRSEPCVEAF